MKKFLTALGLAVTLSLITVFFWLPTQYVVPVIMYHRIAEQSPEPLNTVSPAIFDEQMAMLADKGFDVLSVDEYMSRKQQGRPFSLKTVVITFDDGFDNNYTEAFPVLQKYGFPALIFVGTDNMNKEGRLTWVQMKEMQASGVTFGSHMRTEAYAPDLDQAGLVREVHGSKVILEEKLGVPALYLSYPIGGFTDEAQREVRSAGYKAAFTTNRGFDKKNKKLYEINRIRIKDTDVGAKFLLKVSGYYNLLRKGKKPY